jgi:hypothetical protein
VAAAALHEIILPVDKMHLSRPPVQTAEVVVPVVQINWAEQEELLAVALDFQVMAQIQDGTVERQREEVASPMAVQVVLGIPDIPATAVSVVVAVRTAAASVVAAVAATQVAQAVAVATQVAVAVLITWEQVRRILLV